jgi:hypothetical protein
LHLDHQIAAADIGCTGCMEDKDLVGRVIDEDLVGQHLMELVATRSVMSLHVSCWSWGLFSLYARSLLYWDQKEGNGNLHTVFALLDNINGLHPECFIREGGLEKDDLVSGCSTYS